VALKIGRAGLTLTLPEPQSWDESGGIVTLRGSIQNATTPTDALRLRDQLLGYENNGDEMVVPVIVDGETRLTGYYKVLGMHILTDPTAIANGYLVFDATLQPVPGFAQPMMESLLTTALLTNAVGGVAGDASGFHAAPNTTEYASQVSNTFYTRTSADGVLIVNGLIIPATTIATTHFGLPPASFYIGGATFEQGSPLQPVVGRACQPDVVNWRLSNGLVRVTPNAAAGKLDVSHYNGSTWSAVKTYFVTTSGADVLTTWSAIAVLRNSVEETTIRLAAAVTGEAYPVQATLDISLRRGDRLARCYLTSSPAFSPSKWKIARNTAEAATAITYSAVTVGGIRATANDSDANRYVILTYQRAASVNDLVNGSITQATAGGNIDFAIGSVVPGTASAPDDAVSLANQYLAAQGETQRVVSR
jgi:hypothetical protein